MNKLFKKGLVSLAAASVLATGAVAGDTDYSGSNAEFNTTKDGNFAVILNGQTAKADNVYLYLNNDVNTNDKNLTAGTKLYIELPEKVTFDSEPFVRASENIFKDSAGAATDAKTATVYTTATGKQRAYVETDVNASDDNISLVFEDIYLTVADDYTTGTKDVNVSFGSVWADGTVSTIDESKNQDIATVAKELAKDPIYLKDDALVTADNYDVNVKNYGIVSGGDGKDITLLFTVAAGESSGDVIDITLPSYASFVASSVPEAAVLTDVKDVTDLSDANKTDVTVSVSGAGDNNNTLRITLNGSTVEPTEVEVIISTTDINITTTQTSGTDLVANVEGNATLVNGVTSFTLATMREPNAVVTVKETRNDQNITRGAGNGYQMNLVSIKESFVDDLNSSTFKITLSDGAKFDANNTGPDGKKYSIETSPITGKTSLEINATSLTTGSILDEVVLDLNITVPEDFTGDAVYATIEKDKNNKIETKTVKVANVVNPAVTLDTNITDLKVGIGSTQIMRLDINETYYGSIQIKDSGDNRVYVKAVSCAEINENGTGPTNAGNGTQNGLVLQSGVSIDKSTFRYTINAESKGGPANTYLDLNITVPSTCNVGDKVQLKLVHEDGTEWGPVTLATVGNAAVATAKDVNVTISGDSAIQTLGTLNIKEQWAGALDRGVFSIKAPVGVEFVSADIAVANSQITEGVKGGLGNRVYTFSSAGGSATAIDANITLKGYVSADVTGPIEFEVVDYNATDPNAQDKDTGLVPTKVVLSYATSDGTVPTPTLTADKTSVEEGTEQNITLTCTGTGYGTTSITADANNPSSITLNGSTVTVSADAVAGDTASFTCTETLGGKESAASDAVSIEVKAAAPAEVDPKAEVEDAVVAAGEMPVNGYFTMYDFNGDGTQDYNDWAYTVASNGNTYQLLGNPSTENDLFGWKATDVTVDGKDWLMVHYGTGSLDWLVFKEDCSSVYKLAGAAADGTFSYDVNGDGTTDANDKLDLTCTVSDGKVTFSK